MSSLVTHLLQCHRHARTIPRRAFNRHNGDVMTPQCARVRTARFLFWKELGMVVIKVRRKATFLERARQVLPKKLRAFFGTLPFVVQLALQQVHSLTYNAR